MRRALVLISSEIFRGSVAVALTMGVDVTLLKQFTRFSFVGVLGFLVNLATVYMLRGWVGLYWAGAAAFLTAASVTWIGNRAWTFQDRGQAAAPGQWLLYLTTSLIGISVYYVTYEGLIALIPLCRLFPVLPVSAGSIVGLLANFSLSRCIVFR